MYQLTIVLLEVVKHRTERDWGHLNRNLIQICFTIQWNSGYFRSIVICERDFGYLQLTDSLRKSNYHCVHLQHLLIERNAKQIWEQNQLFILFKSWDKKEVFCIVFFSVSYKACPLLQDFLCELGNLTHLFSFCLACPGL